MFLDPMNPNLVPVFRFEGSVPRYVNFYNENVSFLKKPYFPRRRVF